MGMEEPVADSGRKLAPMIALDQSDHHVESGDAAGAGDAVAVDLEQRRRHGDLGKRLPKGWLVFPMQRHPVPVENACLREKVGTAGNAADGDATAGEAAEPSEYRSVVEQGWVAAGADEQHIYISLRSEIAVGDDGQAIRGHDRLAAWGGVPPAIERPPREQIGGA